MIPFKIVWRLIATLFTLIVEFEVFAGVRELLNLPYDGALTAGVFLGIISLVCCLWLIIVIWQPLMKD